jgi:hypothetical protein
MPKLWVTDEELIKESGVPEPKMRALLGKFDREPRLGFPRKNPLYDNRRYFPAVLEYWNQTNKLPNLVANPQLERKSA